MIAARRRPRRAVSLQQERAGRTDPWVRPAMRKMCGAVAGEPGGRQVRGVLGAEVVVGLLRKPGDFSDGKHGVRSRWPRSALDPARFGRAMRAQGHTLDEIAATIREKWGAEDAGRA